MSNLNDSILVNPSDEHIKALLSKLAYENLSTGFNFSNLNSNFSIAEKNYLNENFEVLSVSDSNESGFQGCFLKNTKTNEVIFAIRGTDELKGADADDDLDIINSGMAYKQFIDAYNYYIKTVTATGDIGKLLKYGNQQPTEGTAYIDTGDGHYIYFEDFTGTGNGYSNVSITGHSLGGHLAALLGVVTGNKATIFNAPGYKDQPKLDFSYVSEDGTTENTISMISGIISKLFEKNINSQADVSHIYNDNSQEWIANYGTNWKNSTPIYCLQEENSVHAINEICTAYYAYETIKDIANGAESFNNDKMGISFNETFENVYKAYCLQFNLAYQTLDYSNYTFIQSLTSLIQVWSETQKANGGAIKVDSFNHSTSLSMTGTDGADIIYTGGGNDTINAEKGNDIVYGIDLNGDTKAAATSTKTINLGSGNDTYYGSNAKDTVSTTGTNTENDTNHIYLGAGNDNFTGGDGADIVDGGTGATGGLTGISQEIMEDTTSNVNDISLGGGDDIYVGGLSKDLVSATSGDNLVILGAGSDTYIGGSGADVVDGGSGSVIKIKEDLINAGYTEVAQLTMDKLKDNTNDTNTIHLEAGNDVYTGGVGIDIVYSGQGNDTINTGGNNDIVYTDDSTDSNDVNKVFLGSGNDKFYGGDGIDIVDGGSENPDIEGIYDPANMVDDENNENTVHLGGGNDRYTGGIGKDIVYSGTGNDNISTGEGNDHVYTNDTNNKNEDKTINLGGGDDKFTGGVANDHVTSGSSNDTNNNHKDIDLGEGNNSYVGGDAQDNVTAGSGDDNISTGGGNDIIDTGDGNNTANGGAGDDRMTGGSGNDILDGGTGKDIFNGKGGNNTINPGNDNDDDTIIAGKGPGKDTVSNFKDNDTIIIPEGIADNRSENGDLIFTTPSGREVILKGRGEPEDPEDEDPQPNLPPNVFDGEGNLYKPDEKGKYRPVDNGLPPFTPDEPNKDKGNTTNGKKHAESQSSPLVVDLDGDGIETLGSGVGIYFDHDNNGFSEDTGWVGKDDGLLVRDINGNGQIDNGTELFGNNTLLSNGEKAKNGFEALKELDSNNDNVFDQNDAAWNEVKVWKDGNSNGVVDDGELLTMEQAGITGVDLNYVDHNYRGDHSDEHGNTCKQEGTFTKTDGSTGQISDIWFDRNTADSKYEAIDVPEDIKTLPNLQGFGNVVSLWEAMASDKTGELKQLVEQYLNTTNITERQNLMTDIIYHWTGVEDIDPESRAAAGDNYIQDARIIEALEEFWGSDYVNQNWLGNEESNPRQQASLILIKTFEDLRDSMMGKLDMQTHYKELFEGISVHYDNEIEDISADVSGFVEQLKTMYDENPADILGIMENLAKLIQEQSVVAPYIIDAIRAAGENLDHNISTYLKNFGDLNAYITNGNDTINGTSGNDYIDGLSGNDVIYGNDGDDTLVGNAGNDRLIGGNGNDTYIFNAGWGNDTIDNSSNDDPSSCEDTIQFGSDVSVDDIVIKRQENDLILSTKDGSNTLRVFSYFVEAGATNNTIKYIKFADGTTWTYEDVRLAWNQNPVSVDGGVTLEGDDNDNSLSGGSGNDILIGNVGNDNISAGSGNDTILAGSGDDYIDGGSGNDSYYYNYGDGMDTISDNGNFDVIVFNRGIDPEKLVYRNEGNDLRIMIDGSETQGVLIKNFFSSIDYKIEELHFADNVVIRLSEIGLVLTQKNIGETVTGTEFGDTIYANDGFDTVNAGKGDDIIIGGKGNDQLNGGEGNDTYIYNIGDGLDTISDYQNSSTESRNDKIKFGEGIKFSDLTFRQNGNDLIITLFNDITQGIVIKSQFSSDYDSIEYLEFADGSQFNLKENGFTFQQTDGHDDVTGTKYDDTIYGGAGNDTLKGENGNDILIGGKGNDVLNGGYGNDTYIWNLGDGLDTIEDYQSSSTDGRMDSVSFGQGISFEDLTFERSGSDLIIYVKGDRTQGVILRNQFNSDYYRIEYLELADGTVKNLTEMGFTFQQTDRYDDVSGTQYDDIIYGNGGNDTIEAGKGNDILIGGKGNDSLDGGYGNDTYVWNLGDGFDTINDYQSSSTEGREDKIKFGEGISFEDLSFENSGNNLIIYVNGDKTQGLQLNNYFYGSNYTVEILEFADGSTVNLTQIGLTFQQHDGSETITGTAYDDVIYADGGNDTVNAGNGNDIIYGGTGDDTLNGQSGNDILTGGTGNDSLDGGYGNDTYVWNLGDGFDTISDYQSSSTEGREDKIKFGEGISFEDLSFENSGNNLIIYVNGDKTQGLQLNNYFYGSNYTVEILEFADGSTVNLTQIGLTFQQHDGSETITGTAYDDVIYANGGNDTVNAGSGNDAIYGGNGNDTLNGQGDNDTLVGGKGNDSLDGGSGNDIYIYNLGDGFDTISDSSGTDKIKFGEGISFEDLSFENDNNNLTVYVNEDKTQGFKINDYFSGSYGIETLEFADGSTVDLTQIGLTFQQHDGSETITGTKYDDVIYANGGDDTVNADSGNDTIYGGTGNDTLNGQNGNDTLIGGIGNDTLNGGAGDDTYIYNLGDGYDIISDSSGNDKIKFGEGISFTDLKFANGDNNSLLIFLSDDKTKAIQINNFISNGNYRIEQLEFADGTTKNLSEMGLTFDQYDCAETITGTDYDDVIYGNGGNDTLYGENGNDILSGGTGHDRLEGGSGDDTYVWNLNDGIDTISDYQGTNKIKFGADITQAELSFAQVGNNLRIIVNNDPSQGLIIENYYNNDGYKIGTIEFADGSEVSVADLIGNLVSLPDQVIEGSADDDILTGGNGNDTINAGDGYNDITGGKGNDTLNGGYDKDTYYYNLGDGYDVISDPYGRDKIIFGEGISSSDLIFQRNGDDLFISFSNNDNDSIRILQHFYNDDKKIEQLEFADGSTINLSKGGLVLQGTDKDNTIDGTLYNDTIYGGLGRDVIDGGKGADIINGGKGDDTIDGGVGEDTIIWNLGDDMDTVTFSDVDHLKFGEGITFEDLTFYAEGNNLRIVVKGDMTQGVICRDYFYSNNNKPENIIFADGSVYSLQQSGLIIHHGDRSESISGTDYADTIYGGKGNNTISGGDGNDIIYGEDGDDTISGGRGTDTIVGGKGNDTIDGGTDADTFIWNLGDDLDTITASNIDKLQFGEGITKDSLTFRSEGNNLRIIINNDETQGIILVDFFYNSNAKLNHVCFADGSSLNLAALGLTLDQQFSKGDTINGTSFDDIINAQNTYSVTINAGDGSDTINAGDGNDTINAGNGNNIIHGGKGNDTLNAGSGNDTYFYNLGDGFDTISDTSGNDKIIFGTGILPEDLTFTQNGYSLIITIKGDTSQGINILNYYNGNPLEELHFADESVKLLPQMDITLQQGNGNETVNGTDSNETIYGNGGNDTINGNYGDDVLIGGAGNDTLDGGGDNDTYVYNLGDGLDTIYDNAGSNKIIFGEGIAQNNLSFTQIDNNLLIYLNGDKDQGIIIESFFSSDSCKIGEIHFADNSVFYLSETGLTLDQSDRNDDMTINGTDYDDTIIGGSGNDTINAGDDDDVITGGKGNDTLNGGYGRDTYIYNLGDGIDTISETRGNDKIKFGTGIALDDLKFTQEGNDLRITINDDVSQSILIDDFYRGTNYQVETLQFADGAIFNLSTQGLTLQQTNANETVNGTSYNDVIYGNGGHDTINAGEGNDTLIGGIGNDYLNGGNGDDTYIYNLGDGFDTITEAGGNDKIVFGEGISQSDLSFEKIGNNLKISINGDEIKGIQINDHFRYDSSKVETIEFHDGSTLDISNADQLIQAMNSFSVSNSASTDTLSNPTENVSDMYSLAASQDLTRKAI